MTEAVATGISRDALLHLIPEARQRTFDLVADLSDEQLLGPRLAIVNPLLWEIGHVAWFQEQWVLRHGLGEPPIRADGDALYDSSAVAHDTRWDLPLPSRAETLAYMREVRDRVLDRLRREKPSPRLLYLALSPSSTRTCTTRRSPTRGRRSATRAAGPGRSERRARPARRRATSASPAGSSCWGPTPASRSSSTTRSGRTRWRSRPSRSRGAPVTQAEFAAFVDDGGYGRRELWSPAGWGWRTSAGAEGPVYWRRAGGGWQRRDFDRWVALEPHRPVIHVNWYEAEAYCRWAGRRLPTEAEWEAAASLEPTADGTRFTGRKRRFPWGDEPPTPARANLDARALGCVDVGALPAGDSAFGCRQMIGNVWEWTASDFLPYPGFAPDLYADYSQPWFGTHKVLRGGCWVTRSRLLRNTWRNFYPPDRRDVWAGFRTCAP